MSMDSYLLIRATEKETSDALCFVRIPADHNFSLDGDARYVTGQFLYSITGLNAVPFREKVACEYMDEAAASAFTEIGGIPVFPLKPHITEGAGYDIFQFTPDQFSPKGVFNSFGSQEREVVAYWLIRWAQHRGTWEGQWEYDDLNRWHNEVGAWDDWSDFRFWHLDQETWYSARGEFRERAGKCIERSEEGVCHFTPTFVERCVATVRRTWSS